MFQTPPEAYDRYMGRYGAKLGRAVIAAAGVQTGDRALDVGCGPGALATELAALLGAENVAAVDPSPPFAQACAERLPGADVRVASGEALPFDADAFDRALAQLSINFMADPAAAAREMRRVTRAGGTVTAAVWDYAGEMPLLRAFWGAAAALDPAVGDRDERRAMRFATPPELEALLAGAGLADVVVAPAIGTARYDGIDDLFAPLELGVGPAGAYTASLAPTDRAALKAELARRLDAGDAPFTLTARAWVATGTVPRKARRAGGEPPPRP
jgi:SAM-dependent methyltransferase